MRLRLTTNAYLCHSDTNLTARTIKKYYLWPEKAVMSGDKAINSLSMTLAKADTRVGNFSVR
jgi:hypothetical protein